MRSTVHPRSKQRTTIKRTVTIVRIIQNGGREAKIFVFLVVLACHSHEFSWSFTKALLVLQRSMFHVLLMAENTQLDLRDKKENGKFCYVITARNVSVVIENSLYAAFSQTFQLRFTRKFFDFRMPWQVKLLTYFFICLYH